jgi:hypothetical protein
MTSNWQIINDADLAAQRCLAMVRDMNKAREAEQKQTARYHTEAVMEVRGMQTGDEVV